MRKFYAVMAAALMSASIFAAPSTIPTVADLAAKYDLANNVVLCCYFDVAPCNDVVLAGSYNGWTSEVSKCLVFQQLDKYDGWWAVEVKWVEGLQAKPLQLGNDGSFDGWDYQVGDPAALSNLGGEGSKEANISGGSYGGESTIEYPGPGAYIYEVAYWKNHNNPCGVIKTHEYHLYLLPPYCEENEDDFVPAIAGAFNDWKIQELDETFYEGQDAYGIVITSAEGKEFKFLEANFGWKNEFLKFNPEDESWNTMSNIQFKEATEDVVTWVFDYSKPGEYKYGLCGVQIYDVNVAIKVPAGAPAAGVELMGNFMGGQDFGKGVAMSLENGKYTAKVRGIEISEFKIREKGDLDWRNQIQVPDEENPGEWKDADNWQFGEEWEDVEGCETCKKIDLDISDPAEYRWADAGPQAIQNVTLTEKAHKVVIDGVLYIVRDNKLFNVQGAQIR